MNYKRVQDGGWGNETVTAMIQDQFDDQGIRVGPGGLQGGYVFTANGSAMSNQRLNAAFFPSLIAGSNDSFAGRESFASFVPQQQSDPAAALTVMLMVNATSVHAPPIYANILHSALYRLRRAYDAGAPAGFNLSDPRDWAADVGTLAAAAGAGIRVSNHPLPYTRGEVASSASMFAFGASAIVLIAFSFLPAYHAAFWAKEREVGAKRQQVMSGVSLLAYWTAAGLIDVCTYIAPVGFALLSAWVFGMTEFSGLTDDRLPAFTAMLALYGAAATPFALGLSQLFKRHGSAQIFVLLLSVLAVILTIATLAMRQIPQTCREEGILRFILRLLPGYALGNGLVSLAFLQSLPAIAAVCDASHGVEVTPEAYSAKWSAFDLRACGWDMIYLGSEAVVFFVVLLAAEGGVGTLLHRCAAACSRASSAVSAHLSGGADASAALEDDDVRAERMRLASLMGAPSPKASASATTGVSKDALARSGGGVPVALHGLRKIFPGRGGPVCCAGGCCTCCCSCCCCGRKRTPAQVAADLASRLPKVAVHDLSFAVAAGEVFGFLGINGESRFSSWMRRID